MSSLRDRSADEAAKLTFQNSERAKREGAVTLEDAQRAHVMEALLAAREVLQLTEFTKQPRLSKQIRNALSKITVAEKLLTRNR